MLATERALTHVAPADTTLAGAVGVLDVPLSRWGTVDESADWEGFAAGCASTRIANAVVAFAPHAACFVDWSGAAAWRALARSHPSLAPLPSAYLNFRVFSTSRGLHHTPRHAAFYRGAETAAIAAATVTVALCRADAAWLSCLALGRDPLGREGVGDDGVLQASLGEMRLLPDVRVLLPPLRSDIETLARDAAAAPIRSRIDARAAADTTADDGCAAAVKNSTATAVGAVDGGDVAPHPTTALDASSSTPLPAAPSRDLLTCVVRLSPEKGSHRFAALAAALAGSGVLTGARIQPFIGGAVGDAPYAEGVLSTLRDACTAAHVPLTVESSFLGPVALRGVFSTTALNVHPALADAYGMTILEAAAFGVPTLVHVGGGGGVVARRRVGVDLAVQQQRGQQGGDGNGGSGCPSTSPTGDYTVDRQKTAHAGPPISFTPALAGGDSVGYLRLEWEEAGWPSAHIAGHGGSSGSANNCRGAGASLSEECLGPLPQHSSASATPLHPHAAPHSAPTVSALEAAALSERVLRMRFPPVGACDLLAPHTCDSRPTGPDASVEGAIIAADLEDAAVTATLVGGLFSSEEGRARLAAVGAAARTLALSWGERHTTAALRSLFTELVEGGGGKGR